MIKVENEKLVVDFKALKDLTSNDFVEFFKKKLTVNTGSVFNVYFNQDDYGIDIVIKYRGCCDIYDYVFDGHFEYYKVYDYLLNKVGYSYER